MVYFVQAQDQRKQQRSASLTVVKGIHRWPINSPRKGSVTREMFPFDDVIMFHRCRSNSAVVITAKQENDPGDRHTQTLYNRILWNNLWNN